ncbi:transporter substrate-binding domain-containing protein [Thiohalocapsa marina]|uniref:Transporter substrate-binding domain-containing protein n=1 Tax=Thiohalocapsa marina TaxID=424902 RepID=A0A5M8FP37_9GAMM|nr:transporter substrate-binding domain-containing protein [Thiohalocapsa marina]KAA6186658.1 transporter substrate-binding domain-containing protein [Thiohalocapsa marina]
MMRRRLTAWLLGVGLGLGLVLGSAPGLAQATEDAQDAADDTWLVATRHAPPFAIVDGHGNWSGISIDLWREIAEQLGLDYRFVDMGLTQMLDAIAEDQADVAAAALTITSEREQRVDFTHPFHTSGLGIAVHRHPGGEVITVLKGLVSAPFLGVLAGLSALLAAVGVLIWLAERRSNDQFQSDPVRGIGSGLWWSAVTMTTVGYGDKAPTTLLGRLIGIIWMFAGIIVISSFTAAIATSLTVGALHHRIKGLDDLYASRVATVGADSTSARFLQEHSVRHRVVDTLPDALQQLAERQLDAVVYDIPMLRYQIAAQFPDQLQVLPQVLQRQDYGFALPQGSLAREAVNEVLLRTIRTEADWSPVLEQYLGRMH